MAWKEKRVLVTGARGFIGRHLVNALLREGALVTALYSDSPGQDSESLRWINGDITEPSTLKDVCKDIDLVYHLAAISNVDASIRDPLRTIRTNVMGTEHMLEEARKSAVKKFVYVSSAHVYGVPKYLPIDENHPVSPREPYAASKIAAENIVQAYGNAYGMEWAILRPFNIFGPGQDPSFLIPGVIEQALKNGVIKVGNTEPTRDFLYVKDAINGFVVTGEKGIGVFNVGSGNGKTVASVVCDIRDAIDSRIDIVEDISRKRTGKVEIPSIIADATRMAALGWSPEESFEGGLRMTIKSIHEPHK